MTQDQETRVSVLKGMPRPANRFDRRTLVRRGAALGAGLAGVSGLAWRGLAAQQASPSPAASPVLSPTTAQDTAPQIVAAANAFLATLDSSQKSTVLFDWSNTAQKQRWSNLPQGLFQRDGLMWGNIGQQAQDAWLKLMQKTLSTEGYNRVVAE